MNSATGFSAFSFFLPLVIGIVYLLLIGIGFYVLYLLIKLLKRAIAALDIYLDEKRNHRL